MPIEDRAFVIGLTGPFGSGCTTAAAVLSDHASFSTRVLSSEIRDEWARLHGNQEPARGDLQKLGNQMRIDAGNPGVLAHLACESFGGSPEAVDRLVLDGIRNVGEVQYLRERFGHRFYLVALECPASERFGRLAGVYGAGDDALAAFRRDNEHDRDQETAMGQQVALCVDLADALIINSDAVTLKQLRDKVIGYVQVLTGETPRYPEPIEVMMNVAYSAAHGSKCLKRQVGAVVVDAAPGEMGDVVGQGFNDNPRPTPPCVDEPRYGADPGKGQPGACYRDIVRSQGFANLARDGAKCPNCGTTITHPDPSPPWNCAGCAENLEAYFWPERAMTLCTAIHAEVAALFAAGRRANGSTLYTTTYPCFQCTEKIIQAGIRAVVFTEPYPDIRAAERIEIAGIEMVRFEGIRSGRFDEIFSRARPYVAEQRRSS